METGAYGVVSNLSASSRLLVATGNPGKVASLRRFLQNLPYDLVGLDAVPGCEPVAESGTTFEENAQLKACGYARQSGWLTLADDSGLEVRALEGAPGVYSARYGGPGLDDRQRCELLLRNLQDIPASGRQARFVCVVAIAEPNGNCHMFRGERTGHIASALRGHHGFGYDPVFIPEGHAHTYAEYTPARKDETSHRAMAMQAARQYLLQRAEVAA